MAFNSTFANDLIKLILQAVAIANIADNAAAAPLANLYIGLHTADPGAAGDQSTSEIAYTGYARVAVVRSAGGWNVAANVANPLANIDFGEMTAGAGGSATHVTVGTSSAGAGKVLLRGSLAPVISVVNGTIPRIKTTSSITFLTA